MQGEPYDTSNGGWPHADTEDRLWFVTTLTLECALNLSNNSFFLLGREEPHGWILDGQPFQVSFHQQSAVTGLPYDLPFYHTTGGYPDTQFQSPASYPTTASNPTMQPDPSFYSPQECPSPQDQISDTTVYQGIPPFQPPISDTYSQVGYNSQLQPYPTTSYTQLPSYNYQGASGGLGLQQPNVQSYLSTPMQFVPQFHGMPSESKSHQVTATSNKPYYCCGRDYGSKHRLRQHMVSGHTLLHMI